MEQSVINQSINLSIYQNTSEEALPSLLLLESLLFQEDHCVAFITLFLESCCDVIYNKPIDQKKWAKEILNYC